MSVNIEDVAKYANVSKSTVSRVLNESGPVSEITKNRVLEAVDKLSYQPNHIARSLKKKKTHFVGLIVPNVQNPFYSKISWHAEKMLQDKNYRTIICNTNYNPTKEEKYIEALKNTKVDGIISVSGEKTEKLCDIFWEEDFPIVFIDRKIKEKNIPYVISDNVQGGQMATRHLIELGHTRIIFLTSDDTQAQRERLKGYKKALKEHNIKIRKEYIFKAPEEGLDKTQSKKIINLIKSKPSPTAIFVVNDYKAIKTLEILRKNNFSVPDDISLIGFDNIDFASLFGLTTIYQPIKKMINIALQKLFPEFNKESAKLPSIIKPKLIERDTTSLNKN